LSPIAAARSVAGDVVRFRPYLRPEAGEHAARLVAHLLDHLTREFREPDLAPIGEGARAVLLGRGPLTHIVAGHVLAAVARQGARELALIGEVVAAVMELHAVAMPRQADIGAVAVHAGVARTWVRSTVTPCALWNVAA
jgi:hypothetical protein